MSYFVVQSYVSFSLGGRSPAVIWFRYDLNPITVKYHERRRPFYTFLTSVSGHFNAQKVWSFHTVNHFFPFSGVRYCWRYVYCRRDH